jgi:glutaredoxin
MSEQKPENNLVIYSAQWCSDCQALKKWMDLNQITYEIRDIMLVSENREALKSQIGKEAVPYILYRGEWIRGYQVGAAFDEKWAHKLFSDLGIIA